MTIRGRCALILGPVSAALLITGCAMRPQGSGATVRVRNNHELPYDGPVRFRTKLPDGEYEGTGGRGEVRAGVARVVVKLPARSDVTLSRSGSLRTDRRDPGPLSATPSAKEIDLRWAGKLLGNLALGLVVLPGTHAEPDDAVRSFEPLDFAWQAQRDGTIKGEVERDGYRLDVTLLPYAQGWVDVRTRLTQTADDSAPAYVAFVRRVTSAPGIDSARLRFNGRVVDGANSPDVWARDFWYTRGVDWISWKAGALSMAAMSGFTPVPTIKRDSVWMSGSHFYVWDRTRRDGDQLYLISEIAGPNPKQAKSGYMRVTPYAPIRKGDALELTWRLAIVPQPAPGWEDSQLRVFAGYRAVHLDSGAAVVDLGVPGVQFGTSYFPYSTFTENFDYYRTPGLDRETFWPFSPAAWKDWRAFIPRMRTDLHIIRAMGFGWVRLHHLELLQEMDRKDALAFLDFYMGTARQLGLKVLIDTEGPSEWVSLIAGRYRDVVRRIDIENEILIPGITPSEPARWTTLYRAAKQADPDAQVFLTSAGNDGTFERLRTLGVPFDRVGLHAYKHGPEWVESLSSHALEAAGYARSLGKFVTVGEFNWKGLTRLSPDARAKEFAAVYEAMLAPRAIPELFQFQFQETLSANPSIARKGIRHYETLMLDRRPKPGAFELMRLIRQYASPESAVGQLDVVAPEAVLRDGQATVPVTLRNRTSHQLTITLRAEAYDGLRVRLVTPARVVVPADSTVRGRVLLQLDSGAATGTYHWFLRADFGGQTRWGWGVAAHEGAPTLDAKPVLAGHVVYPQGAEVVRTLPWHGPLTVAWGPHAPVLDVEMAYMVANTLESATGRPVTYMSTADLPDSLQHRGLLILVGTSRTNPLIDWQSSGGRIGVHTGVVRVAASASGTKLLLTGRSTQAVEAAATDFVLRYWRHAKDAGIRITGMEPGAALGHPAEITATVLP